MNRMLAGALLAAAACGEQAVTTPTPSPLATSLAVAPGQPGATGIVRGVVIGDRLVATKSPVPATPPDTGAAVVYVPEVVVNAAIEVFKEVRDSASDTGPVTVTRSRVGSLVTAADEKFELTSVLAGYYRLEVTPPIGSPYHAASSGTVSFSNQSTGSAVVSLSTH